MEFTNFVDVRKYVAVSRLTMPGMYSRGPKEACVRWGSH